jgi:hypothetical protein
MVSDSISGLAARYFIGAERHYLGGWHAHGLVKYYEERVTLKGGANSTLSSARLLEIRLSRRGFSRVEPIRDRESVAGYVAKYITKHLDADWDIYGFKGWVV